ncbi:hypothetical protein KK092_09635 [Curtobacterium flaccumfaciens pv. flaccumfaciens]|uniref:hypothetical protein n=1 Tax=Curtobacterium flaccumfaciens TaxID=2035 RepID=UPI001BDDF2AC|nr:hypothetical protein [Curtobacterium flaccumfaciens]MBT1669642.1 hypothetical protein [Curtobacterium flaccumfaciens pv. flaccumfaciens]
MSISTDSPESPDDEGGVPARDTVLRDSLFIPEADVDPESYPRLTNMSAAFMFKAVVRPATPALTEYVSIRAPHDDLALAGAIGRWNLAWEAGQFRRRFFDPDDMPPQLAALAELGDQNIQIVPRTRSRYFEYEPLIHLLPRHTLERCGLPLFRSGQWPFLADVANVDRYLGADLGQRLARAWAMTVWPHLSTGSRMNAFASDDSIRLLSHNLDFWIPAVTRVIQDRLTEFPLVDNGIEPGPVPLEGGGYLDGAIAGNPRMGGDIWAGEAEAAAVIEETIAAADQTGQLRGILDAIRSNRVEEDFSTRWSNAREDFERKLYKKRSKVGVRFVELTDTVPVQGPSSDMLGDLVTNEFLTVLDARNRQIVVLLNSGFTTATEIAGVLGYANHSAVTKRLTKIRAAAERFFEN